MLSKNDIIYNIPPKVKQLYNHYIQLAKFKLTYKFLLISNYNNVCELINEFTNHEDVLAMKTEYNNKVLKFKQHLKKLNGELNSKLIEFDNQINIDDITGLWELQSTNNSNIIQYFLPVKHLWIDSNDLYFNVDKDKTEEINQLGFLNKFQYDILHTKDNNQYLNALKLRLNINPLNLCSEYLRTNMLNIIKDLSYNDIEIIKKYWLLSEFTDKDLYDINNIFANKLLSKI